MTNILTVEDLKKHLNVDHSEDDDYIFELELVAQDYIANYLQRPLSELTVEQDGATVTAPAVRHAIRLLVGQWYANREPVAFASASEVPYGLAALLVPLKTFHPSDEEAGS